MPTILEIISLYGGGPGSGRHPEGKEKPLSQRAQTAKDTYKPVTTERRQLATRNERMITKAVSGIATMDNSPFDVIVRGKFGIEVKTLVDQTNDKITMHPESLARKVASAKKLGLTSTYTVAVDMRTGKPQIYYKSGLGSFRIGSMTPLKSIANLKQVIK